MTRRSRALFVTWDGTAQQYLESLYLPILRAVPGFDFEVLQFTWADQMQVERIRQVAARYGIGYRSVPIWRRPSVTLSSAATILRGARLLRRQLAQHPVDVVVARSLMPAAIVHMARRRGPQQGAYVFDADGLAADERVEFTDASAQSRIYSVLRAIEANALRTADLTMTRTDASREVLLSRGGPGLDARVRVVPNAKDPAIFHPGDDETRRRTREAHGVDPNAPWMVYVGSVGPQYCFQELFALFAEVQGRDRSAKLTILTGQPEEAQRYRVDAGIGPSGIAIQRVPPDAVPDVLAAADLGVALRRPTYSQRAVCPIKVGEYLLCGLPVVANQGIGDLDRQVPKSAGLVLESLSKDALTRTADWLLKHVIPKRGALREVARDAGLHHFGLGTCATAVESVLREAMRVCGEEKTPDGIGKPVASLDSVPGATVTDAFSQQGIR